MLGVALVLAAAAWWLPCWRGRMASCELWCSLGANQACNVLARNHDEGDGTDIRDDLAVELYKKACDGGYATACVNLGIMYEHAEGVAPSPIDAAVLYRRACPEKLGACRRLAALMVDGHVAHDTTVVPFLERACEGHDEEAMKSCNALARMYDTGRGPPLDDRAAVKLYTRACHGHLGAACYNLSLMYRRGEGVARDPRRAAELEQLACRNGERSHCR